MVLGIVKVICSPSVFKMVMDIVEVICRFSRRSWVLLKLSVGLQDGFGYY